MVPSLIEILESNVISEIIAKSKTTEKEDFEMSSLSVLTSNFIIP